MPVNTNYTCAEHYGKEQSDLGSRTSLYVSIVTAVVFLILIILFGNSLVIGAIVKFRGMQNIQNILLMSLAICDLFIGVFIIPLTLAYELLDYWPFGYIACKIYLLMDIALCTASIWSMCMISINRYLALKLGTKYRLKNNVQTGTVMIILVWCFSLVICLPSFLHAASSNPDPLVCTHSDQLWYITYSVSCSFYIPMVVMCSMYSYILWNFRKKIKESKVRTALIRQEKRMHTLVVVTMSTFIVCWLPFFLIYITTALCSECCVPPTVIKLFEWLGYVNCAVNPIIYAITRSDFRSSFLALLKNTSTRVNPIISVIQVPNSRDSKKRIPRDCCDSRSVNLPLSHDVSNSGVSYVYS